MIQNMVAKMGEKEFIERGTVQDPYFMFSEYHQTRMAKIICEESSAESQADKQRLRPSYISQVPE
jgi:hypothetical protein